MLDDRDSDLAGKTSASGSIFWGESYNSIYSNYSAALNTGVCISDWYNRIFTITIIILWIRLYNYMRPFKSFGPFIVILTKVIGDIGRFTTIYIVVFIPFCLAFWIMFGGEGIDNMDTFDRLVFTIFRMILVDEYAMDAMLERDNVMGIILIGGHILIGSIIAINLMIALLSDSFQRVYDNAQEVAIYQQAEAIKTLEDFYVQPEVSIGFLREMEEKGNPLEEDYDDDAADSNTDAFGDMKKASVQAVEILQDMVEKLGLDDLSSDTDDDSEGLSSSNARKAKSRAKLAHRLGLGSGTASSTSLGDTNKRMDRMDKQLNLINMQINNLDTQLSKILDFGKNYGDKIMKALDEKAE